jgi:N-acetylglucosaminyl-diphospho-decaprenol L-rhamnosyltransferase
MSSSLPLVTLSVISHGDRSALQSLLASICREEDPGRLQLIVTDNLGRDLPDLDRDRWESLELLHNQSPQGYARNHNAAFRHARGHYFCVLGPDVEFLEPTLERLTVVLQHGEADILAPLVVDPKGRIQDSFRRLPTPWELVGHRIGGGLLRTDAPAGPLGRPDWVAGVFMMMSKGTFSALDGFDPRYHMYLEDVDLCTRARLAGLSVAVDSRVRVQHDARRASRRSGRYLMWHVRSAVRFFTSETYRRAKRMASDRD